MHHKRSTILFISQHTNRRRIRIAHSAAAQGCEGLLGGCRCGCCGDVVECGLSGVMEESHIGSVLHDQVIDGITASKIRSRTTRCQHELRRKFQNTRVEVRHFTVFDI